MRQALLILWKDVRQLRWQLGAYALLLAAFAWVSPQTWPGTAPDSFLSVFVTLLRILLMASQFVLITSAIHADRLVGEEQFWITRPYDWRSLLASKFLFVLACVVLPYLFMQWSLLHAAGLNPFTAKAGMAACLVRFAVVPCLVSMLIASVTETLAAAFGFLVALLLAWAGILQLILAGTELRMSPPYEFAVFGALFGVLLLAILAYQFARRRAAHSRIAIAVTLALFLLFIFGYDRQGFGTPVKNLIRSHYHVPSAGSLHLVFAPGSLPYQERGQDLQYLRHAIEVKLPVRLQGLPPDTRLRETNATVTLTSNGLHYASPWQSATVSENAIGFAVPTDVFDRFAGQKIQLHLELIGDQMRPTQVQQIAAANRFRAPSNAICILTNGAVVCRYPYVQLVPTHVEAMVGTAACGASSALNPAGTWLLIFPPGGKVDPVVNEPLHLHGRVCSGSPLTFTEYGSPHRFRLAIDIPDITLRDYQAARD